MDAKREAEIRARHAKRDAVDVFEMRDIYTAYNEAHADRGDLLAALDMARDTLNVLLPAARRGNTLQRALEETLVYAEERAEQRGELQAENARLRAAHDEARAQLRVLARYVAHEADATGETLPDLTNGEAREAIDLARELVEADDNGT